MLGPGHAVLYVDGDALARHSFARILTDATIQVHCVETLDEAVALTHRRSFSAVFLECTTSLAASLEFIERIHHVQPGAAYVLVTSHPDFSLVKRSQGASYVTEIMTTPLHPQVVLATVLRAIELSSDRLRSAVHPESAGRAPRLLIVNDEPTDLELIRIAFAKSAAAGDFESVATLRAALDVVATSVFDLAVVDLELPDARGVTAVVQLRAAAPYLPIVVLTSCQSEHLASQVVRLGAEDYLIKGDISTDHLRRAATFAIERAKNRTVHGGTTANAGLPGYAAFFRRLSLGIQAAAGETGELAAMVVAVRGLDIAPAEAQPFLLRAAGERLRARLAPNDFIAHLGKNQFGVVVAKPAEGGSLDETAEQVLESFDLPFVHATATVALGAAVSAVAHQPGDDASQLIARVRTGLAYPTIESGKRRPAVSRFGRNA